MHRVRIVGKSTGITNNIKIIYSSVPIMCGTVSQHEGPCAFLLSGKTTCKFVQEYVSLKHNMLRCADMVHIKMHRLTNNKPVPAISSQAGVLQQVYIPTHKGRVGRQ